MHVLMVPSARHCKRILKSGDWLEKFCERVYRGSKSWKTLTEMNENTSGHNILLFHESTDESEFELPANTYSQNKYSKTNMCFTA